MKRLWASLDRLSAAPAAVTGVCGTRALLGFTGFMFYAGQYSDRRYLFGPDGVYPWRDFVQGLHDNGTFSLLSLSASGLWFEIVFHMGLLAALAVMLGLGGRAVLVLHWALLWSVFQRQPLILDGGDNLAYLVLPMLLLTRCYDRFAVSFGLVRRWASRVPGTLRAVTPALHNLGVAAIAAQICLVYVVSGLCKVQGRVWQDGTALFYVLRIPEFEWPGVSRLVYENDLLVVAGTYAATLFMVYFPLGVLVPRLRSWAAVGSIGLHVSIALLMGLTGFALTMVACDLVFLSRGLDNAVRAARRAGDRVRRAAERQLPWLSRPVGSITAGDAADRVTGGPDIERTGSTSVSEQAGRSPARTV
ncbi:HTTM domain-containing protein [Streptomyces sp. SID89]|nr:HTTM domain-containing protein [Streptomyces sp. SID89]NED72361.1 HTTM domain-containing protein [Streptomyces sp. SID9944]